jgi:hypothetical protein
MTMISYEGFGRLRLATFLEPEAEIVRRDNWEFMDCWWLGDGHKFSEFLRLCNDPDVTRSVAVDFRDLTAGEASAIMSAVSLPLSHGMTRDDICRVLNTEPLGMQQFCADRKRLKFTVGDAEKYYLSCTVLNEGGLIYVVVMREDYLTAQPEMSSYGDP